MSGYFRFLPRIRAASAMACSLLLAVPALAQGIDMPQMDLPRTHLRVGKASMEAQIASTFNERQIGLMHRKSMPVNEGMLFVFPQSGVQCFWMKNTVLPLTAAFVAADGTIVNLADMQPMSEQSHCSARAVPYVLEMRQGWFKRNRILPGMKIRDVQGRYFQGQ